MIYIGQYKGNPVYYEVLFVAKTYNQTCNKLQDTEDYCPNCGARLEGEAE